MHSYTHPFAQEGVHAIVLSGMYNPIGSGACSLPQQSVNNTWKVQQQKSILIVISFFVASMWFAM